MNIAPVFSSSVDDISLFQLESYVIPFPSYLDENFQDTHIFFYTLGDLTPFFTFDEATRGFTLETNLNTPVGEFEIEFGVQDIPIAGEPESDLLKF